jgi:hypothetical protein
MESTVIRNDFADLLESKVYDCAMQNIVRWVDEKAIGQNIRDSGYRADHKRRR